MTTIVLNLQRVRERITTACVAAGRDPACVRLLAVSKTFGADAVMEALLAGQRAFGENYIAEGVEKILLLRAWQAGQGAQSGEQSGAAANALEWHCIGPVQSNKTRLVAEHFDWVQSVDRLKIAQRLSEQRPPHLPPLQICLQVNVDGGVNKSGLTPADVQALAQEVTQLPRLALRGLMAIPEPAINFIAACALHKRVKAIFDHINSSGVLPVPMDTLSLGMTADLEAAIHAGSTMVRVGTAIFGGRSRATG
ncbi:YggS family pyridoxal phosphate-dependent enzyme [Polaromonas sp. UBA4122]|uniref:YggS family pyridoxal phosphate-dependent enzyme n=1 Tax=Polaromonas sp. UBA4122 TaxID=1947074 RepID=UPI0025F1FF40|nr:YggS family pyridoxal phosphate-dependent enzyme [Polaromonas sp. UBA4122]